MANYTTTEKEVLWKLIKRSNPKFDVPLAMFNYKTTPLEGDGIRNTGLSITDLQTGQPIIFYYDRLDMSKVLGSSSFTIAEVTGFAAAKTACMQEYDRHITAKKIKVDPKAEADFGSMEDPKQVVATYSYDSVSMLFNGTVRILCPYKD